MEVDSVAQVPVFEEGNNIDDAVAPSDSGGMFEDKVEDSRACVISRLEAFVLDFLRQVSKALPVVNDAGNIHSQSKVALRLADRRKPLNEDGASSTRLLIFPQNVKHPSSRAIAQVLRALDLIHEALVTGVPTTKRDMYYKDVPLFGSQAVIDRLVDDIAATLGVRRADLNVRAASKGVVSGRGLSIHFRGGECITVSRAENTLIPPSEEIERFDVEDNLSWILVVEKEAVFQTLCRLDIADHPELPGPGLLITGKGYPDVATRQLVSTLSENLPSSIPIIALVDCDPYGIDILSMYKFGSTSMMHEQEFLAAPRVTWGGVRSTDIAALGLSKDTLIPITEHDQKKAMAMMRRPNLPRKWKAELQHMLHTRRKAEIEVLSTGDIKPAAPAEQSQREAANCHTSGLLEYVLGIINTGVVNARRKYASRT